MAVNPTQPVPASTAWLAVAAVVLAVKVVEDLAAAMGGVVAVEVAVAATAAAMAAADLSVAD